MVDCFYKIILIYFQWCQLLLTLRGTPKTNIPNSSWTTITGWVSLFGFLPWVKLITDRYSRLRSICNHLKQTWRLQFSWRTELIKILLDRKITIIRKTNNAFRSTWNLFELQNKYSINFTTAGGKIIEKCYNVYTLIALLYLMALERLLKLNIIMFWALCIIDMYITEVNNEIQRISQGSDCLTPHSPIFEFYCGRQFYCGRCVASHDHLHTCHIKLYSVWARFECW